MKRHICAVSFGTADSEVAKRALEPMEQAIARAFPEGCVLRAYTSTRMAVKPECGAEPAEEMLDRLRAQGADAVVCALFVADGGEYGKLCRAAGDIPVSEPLLHDEEDLKWMAGLLSDIARSNERKVIAVIHGQRHGDNEIRSRLQTHCGAEVFVTCLEGDGRIEELLPELKKCADRRLLLIPLTLTAGKHVRKDVAGEQPDSHLSILKREGFDVQARMQSLLEQPCVRERFLKKLRAVCG